MAWPLPCAIQIWDLLCSRRGMEDSRAHYSPMAHQIFTWLMKSLKMAYKWIELGPFYGPILIVSHIKWGLQGFSLHGHVNLMQFLKWTAKSTGLHLSFWYVLLLLISFQLQQTTSQGLWKIILWNVRSKNLVTVKPKQLWSNLNLH